MKNSEIKTNTAWKIIIENEMLIDNFNDHFINTVNTLS